MAQSLEDELAGERRGDGGKLWHSTSFSANRTEKSGGKRLAIKEVFSGEIPRGQGKREYWSSDVLAQSKMRRGYWGSMKPRDLKYQGLQKNAQTLGGGNHKGGWTEGKPPQVKKKKQGMGKNSFSEKGGGRLGWGILRAVQRKKKKLGGGGGEENPGKEREGQQEVGEGGAKVFHYSKGP